MSTRRDPRVFLWDARTAGETALRFTHGKSFHDFASDDLLRSAVERQLQVLGEALTQLSRIDAETAARVPHLSQIIAFRNILVHGYASIDLENVWRIVNDDVPGLIETLGVLLGPETGSAGP